MNIPLKMNRDFEKAMTTLNERYGEDFEYLNGFHETQLNFSDCQMLHLASLQFINRHLVRTKVFDQPIDDISFQVSH